MCPKVQCIIDVYDGELAAAKNSTGGPLVFTFLGQICQVNILTSDGKHTHICLSTIQMPSTLMTPFYTNHSVQIIFVDATGLAIGIESEIQTGPEKLEK